MCGWGAERVVQGWVGVGRCERHVRGHPIRRAGVGEALAGTVPVALDWRQPRGGGQAAHMQPGWWPEGLTSEANEPKRRWQPRAWNC